MPRKYRAPKERASVFPPTWWMRQDLQFGPHPLGDESDEHAYERHLRRGFETLAALEAYWRENRRRLFAEYGADAVIDWWAFKTWE